MISTKYSRNKIMANASYTFLVLFALFAVTKIFLPDTGDGWSNPPIFDYLFLFGIGMCFSIIGIGNTYYSWTLNKEEFIEWYMDQQLFGRNWIRNFYPEVVLIWTNRISAPIITILSITISSSMLFAIFKYL